MSENDKPPEAEAGKDATAERAAPVPSKLRRQQTRRRILRTALLAGGAAALPDAPPGV